MFKDSDFKLEGDQLMVRKDQYALARISDIYAVKLAKKHTLLRVLGFGLLFSAVVWPIDLSAWSTVPSLGGLAFLLGALAGLFTAKKFELRATFSAVDETGERVVPIARGANAEEFQLFTQVAERVKAAC